MAACKPSVLDKFLVVEDSLGNGMCWLDKIVDLCFKSIQLLENRFMFVQLMLVVTNFLSSCTADQLFQIRNEQITELLVFAIQDWTHSKQSEGSTSLLVETLQVLRRLMEINWSELIGDCGFKLMLDTIEKLDAFDHITRLTMNPNDELSALARDLVDKYFKQDNDTDLNSPNIKQDDDLDPQELCHQRPLNYSGQKPQQTDSLFSQSYHSIAAEPKNPKKFII